MHDGAYLKYEILNSQVLSECIGEGKKFDMDGFIVASRNTVPNHVAMAKLQRVIAAEDEG